MYVIQSRQHSIDYRNKTCMHIQAMRFKQWKNYYTTDRARLSSKTQATSVTSFYVKCKLRL